MKKLYFLFVGFALLFLSSCSPYVKLLETEASGTTKSADKYIAFENDSIKVTYNLWDNGGVMYYVVYNKLDVPLYVDWKKSGYVVNDIKYNYWQDRTVSEVTQSATLIPGTKIVTYLPKTVTIADERITFIPPKSQISIPFTYPLISGDASLQYDISNNDKKIKVQTVDLRHDKTATKQKVDKTWKGSGKTTVFEKTFTRENSPFTFRNFMTYSTTESFQREGYVNTSFAVVKMTEMKAKQFYGKGTPGVIIVKKGKKAKPVKVKTKFWSYPYKSSDSFYIMLGF